MKSLFIFTVFFLVTFSINGQVLNKTTENEAKNLSGNEEGTFTLSKPSETQGLFRSNIQKSNEAKVLDAYLREKGFTLAPAEANAVLHGKGTQKNNGKVESYEISVADYVNPNTGESASLIVTSLNGKVNSKVIVIPKDGEALPTGSNSSTENQNEQKLTEIVYQKNSNPTLNKPSQNIKSLSAAGINCFANGVLRSCGSGCFNTVVKNCVQVLPAGWALASTYPIAYAIIFKCSWASLPCVSCSAWQFMSCSRY